MNLKSHTFFAALFVMCHLQTAAQADSVQNLYFTNLKTNMQFCTPDYRLPASSFYIYRNCVYNFVLKNKRQLAAKVVDIRNDSIYYTSYNNQKLPAEEPSLAIHPSQIKSIQLVADRIMAIYTSVQLKKYRFVFEKSISPKEFRHVSDTAYSPDSGKATIYEIVPVMTRQGLDQLYERRGEIYYYEGQLPVENADTVKLRKDPIVKRFAWFTPSNANKIKGLNIGLQTMNFQDEPLAIEGVNINADVLSVFVTFMLAFRVGTGNHPVNLEDSPDKSQITDTLKGVSFSFGGLATHMLVKGLAINGGICGIEESRGLVITGTQNFTDDFRGVIISGLRNRCIRGRGLQIALLNVCKDLKGIQLGLWNINGKRRLPFINWDF